MQNQVSLTKHGLSYPKQQQNKILRQKDNIGIKKKKKCDNNKLKWARHRRN